MKRKKDDKKIFTEFEKKVFKCVLSIPLGEVRSYKWVAKKIGKPLSFRAVGRALRKNPFPFIIPCHRVVRADKDFGDYSLGRDLKKKILTLEKKIKEILES